MDDLPVELLSRIVKLAVLSHPIPSSVLSVRSTWKSIGQPFLERHLEFRRPSQLDSFSACFGRGYFSKEAHTGRKISPISISFGKTLSDCGIYRFHEVVTGCDQTLLESFALHTSYQVGSDRYYLFEFLKSLKSVQSLFLETSYLNCRSPKRFEWSAQDPENNFSLAVSSILSFGLS